MDAYYNAIPKRVIIAYSYTNRVHNNILCTTTANGCMWIISEFLYFQITSQHGCENFVQYRQ